MKDIIPIIDEKTKFVFMGETGSGKSEFAINLALYLRQNFNKEVNLFDMDQSKPLFRPRDVKELFVKNNVLFHQPASFMDSPIVPHAVAETLSKPGSQTLLDIGGNIFGALSVAQYSEYLHDMDTIVFYTINVYRCFSNESENIIRTMNALKSASKLNNIIIVSNPNFGENTTDEDVISGNRILEQFLNGFDNKIGLYLINESFDIDKTNNSDHYFIIRPYLNYLK